MLESGKNRRNEIAISTLAFNICKYRLQSAMTIEELANRIDIDYSQISRMERSIVNPNVSIIFDIAVALEIEPSLLLEK